MDSRQRVLTALKHQEADRVPVDLNGMRSTGIMAIAYNRLKAYLGLEEGATRVYDITQQLAEPDEAMLERFEVDVLPLPRLPKGLSAVQPGWKPYTLPDGSPALVPAGLHFERGTGCWLIRDTAGNILYKMPDGALYFDTVYHPLAQAQTIAEIESYQLPLISDAELEWLAGEARRICAAGRSRAVMGHTGINLYETAQRLRGWEQFMLDLGGNQALVQALMEKLAENAIRNLERYLGAVGGYVDILQMGDDLGTQSGPQISSRMYRRSIKPFHQRIFQYAKQASSKPVFLHCCGGIFPLLPDLIEAGLDILNPVQIAAVGMDPAALKRDFGRDLVFWGGGADSQRVLPTASPAEVRDHVRRLVEIFAPGGGFVFCAVHNIQADVPPENITAMYQAALEFGRYSAPGSPINNS
jgi:uroporphyrinogen decarboxylase